MALNTPVKQSVLDTIVSYFGKIYLGKVVQGAAVVTGNTVGSSPVSTRIVDVAKDLVWAASNGTNAATTNSATSSPINYSVPSAAQIEKLYLTDDNATEGSRIVHGIINIPTPLPSYATGDGAYYVRGLDITLTEV